ncbi:MAG: Alpha/beta hydrolase fold protein [Homoserinimonas sp.]|jgi:pimeloyl-ACP methyl ester carboxylesterase|nr:Alpha/beta hydrolase fold protein [Homoserinimonas sp.]
MTTAASLHAQRFGSGRPLVLVHGLGSSWVTWAPLLEELAAERQVIAVDLPGHGASAPLTGDVTVAALADALTQFMNSEGLASADLAGASLGARLVLELARRGMGGNVVALDPGGFWSAGERVAFGTSMALSLKLVRMLQPRLPAIVASPVGRTMLMAQFSAHPWRLEPAFVLAELRGFSRTISPGLDPTLESLVRGPNQRGALSTPGRVSIGWGEHDKVTGMAQATRALRAFPDATLQLFADSGHFPHWDEPASAARFILAGVR